MSSAKSIVVYGAGGLARETEWIIERINEDRPRFRFEGYVVTDLAMLGDNDSKDEVVGDEKWLFEQKGLHVVVAIGTPHIRLAVSRRLESGLGNERMPILMDPSVIYDQRTAVIEPGVVIAAGSVLTVSVKIERFTYVNPNCSIAHEVIVGPGCVLKPHVAIAGGVCLKEGVMVGTGAQVLQYRTVGARSIVGAGALVTKNVEPDTTVVGVPARTYVKNEI